MRKRILAAVLVLAAGAVPGCVCRRNATIRPELAIRVVDATGKPAASAHVGGRFGKLAAMVEGTRQVRARR